MIENYSDYHQYEIYLEVEGDFCRHSEATAPDFEELFFGVLSRCKADAAIKAFTTASFVVFSMSSVFRVCRCVAFRTLHRSSSASHNQQGPWPGAGHTWTSTVSLQTGVVGRQPMVDRERSIRILIMWCVVSHRVIPM